MPMMISLEICSVLAPAPITIQIIPWMHYTNKNREEYILKGKCLDL